MFRELVKKAFGPISMPRKPLTSAQKYAAMDELEDTLLHNPTAVAEIYGWGRGAASFFAHKRYQYLLDTISYEISRMQNFYRSEFPHKTPVQLVTIQYGILIDEFAPAALLTAAEYLATKVEEKVSGTLTPEDLKELGHPYAWGSTVPVSTDVNVVTGRLRKSIFYTMPEREPTLFGKIYTRWKTYVGVDLTKAPYARFIIFGTKKMRPRDFLTETLMEEKDRLRQIIYDVMKEYCDYYHGQLRAYYNARARTLARAKYERAWLAYRQTGNAPPKYERKIKAQLKKYGFTTFEELSMAEQDRLLRKFAEGWDDWDEWSLRLERQLLEGRESVKSSVKTVEKTVRIGEETIKYTETFRVPTRFVAGKTAAVFTAPFVREIVKPIPVYPEEKFRSHRMKLQKGHLVLVPAVGRTRAEQERRARQILDRVHRRMERQLRKYKYYWGVYPGGPGYIKARAKPKKPWIFSKLYKVGHFFRGLRGL